MAFLVWGLLACSGAYWIIQVAAKPLATPAQALPVLEQSGAQVDLTRLLGAPVVAVAEAAPVQDSRFTLLGVVAPLSARAAQAGEGVALIAVDGVARTVRVGAEIDGGLRLLAVDARSARFGGKEGAPGMTLQLAAPMQATTGALQAARPSPVNLGGNPQVPMPQVMPPMPTNGGQAQDPQQPQVDNRGNPLS